MSQVVCSYCGKTWDSSVGPFCPDDGTYLPFSDETDESAEIAEDTLRRPDEPVTQEIEPAPPPPLAEPVAEGFTIVCPQCGTVNDASRTFCTQCGHHLHRASEPVPPPVAAGGLTRTQRILLGVGAGLVGIVLIWWGVSQFGGDDGPGPSGTAVAPTLETTAPTDAPPPTTSPATTAAPPTALPPEPVPIPASEVTASATSVLEAAGDITYDAANTLDGDLDTAWNGRNSEGGVGERLRYQFAEPVDLARIDLINGYVKVVDGESRFLQNNRLTSVTVITEAGQFPVEIADTQDWQTIEGEFGVTSFVRLRIDGVAPATVPLGDTIYDTDIAVTEIRFWARPG